MCIPALPVLAEVTVLHAATQAQTSGAAASASSARAGAAPDAAPVAPEHDWWEFVELLLVFAGLVVIGIITLRRG